MFFFTHVLTEKKLKSTSSTLNHISQSLTPTTTPISHSLLSQTIYRSTEPHSSYVNYECVFSHTRTVRTHHNAVCFKISVFAVS